MSNPTPPQSEREKLREKLIKLLMHFTMPAVSDGVAVALRGIQVYGDADAMMEDGTDYDEWLEDMAEKNANELADFIIQEKTKTETATIKILEQTQANMRPLIAFRNSNDELDGEWIMYWDDAEQVWTRARYADIVKEVRIALTNQQETP